MQGVARRRCEQEPPKENTPSHLDDTQYFSPQQIHSGEEAVRGDELSEIQIRGWRAVSAVGFQGIG